MVYNYIFKNDQGGEKPTLVLLASANLLFAGAFQAMLYVWTVIDALRSLTNLLICFPMNRMTISF